MCVDTELMVRSFTLGLSAAGIATLAVLIRELRSARGSRHLLKWAWAIGVTIGLSFVIRLIRYLAEYL